MKVPSRSYCSEGGIIDFACILGNSLMSVSVRFKSMGGIPAASCTSPASVKMHDQITCGQ